MLAAQVQSRPYLKINVANGLNSVVRIEGPK